MRKKAEWILLPVAFLMLALGSGCGEEEGKAAPCAGVAGLGGQCTAGKGECARTGTYVCAQDGKTLECDATPGATAEEACDGKDNDCDGQTDEDLTGAGQAECSDKGVCSAGVNTYCVDGSWTCLYSELDGYEETEVTCDSLDNDCDGETDEDLSAPPDAVCLSQGVCSSQAAVVCNEGEWVCDYSQTTGYEPEEASCDSLDNDCDGETDEDLVQLPDETCPSEGVCEKGLKMTCSGGNWACDYSEVFAYQSIEIACDDLDNDCDGFNDEDGVCGVETCENIAAGTVKCSYPIGGTATPAIGDDGTVYVTASAPEDNQVKLFAMNPADCAPLWEYTPSAGDIFYCLQPSIRPDGMVYLPCATPYSDVPNYIFVVNAEGGEESVITLPELVAPAGIAIGTDGTIYFGNRYCCGKFYAVNPDGTMKWTLDTGGSEFDGPPAIASDGTIFAGTWKFRNSPEEKIYAISDEGDAGRIVWEFSPPETSAPYDTSGIFLNSYPAIGSDGTIYAGILGKIEDNLAATLYALARNNGSKRWSYTISENTAGLNNAVVVGSDDAIYFISGQFGGYGDPELPSVLLLHAVKPDGMQKWPPFSMPDICWNASPALGADDKIYVAAKDTLYCVNQADGAEAWSIGTEGCPSGVTIGTNKAVYFMTQSRFYSVCSGSIGLADSPWPKMLHDRRNTGNYGAQ